MGGVVMERPDDRPVWDEQQATALLGATVLIGVTRVLADGFDQEQMFGVIKSADARRGFEIALEGSRQRQTYWLPPDLRNFTVAPAGEYRLRSTGEVVIDPDFTCSWTMESSAR